MKSDYKQELYGIENPALHGRHVSQVFGSNVGVAGGTALVSVRSYSIYTVVFLMDDPGHVTAIHDGVDASGVCYNLPTAIGRSGFMTLSRN